MEISRHFCVSKDSNASGKTGKNRRTKQDVKHKAKENGNKNSGFDLKVVEALMAQSGMATTTVLRDAIQTQLRAPIRRSLKRLVKAGVVTVTAADSKRKTFIIELRNNGRPALA